MNTKPILFSTEMVQAILEGRKTQTRRTKGLKVVNDNPDSHTFNSFSIDNSKATFKRIEGMWQAVDAPYKTGDILWVRESFNEVLINSKDAFIYKADWDEESTQFNWKPSIHMPKKACRLFLKITNVRAERLLEISEEEARKEGVKHLIPRWKDYTNEKGFCYNAWSSFKTLWIKINGIESYTSNPWVWVIEFERIEKPENF